MAKEKDWWEPWHTPEEEEELILNTERDIAMRKGMEAGIEKGRAEGIEEGLEQANIIAVQNMARDNIKPDLIAKYVNLPVNKVQKILSNIIF